jgi:hypothetical protein
VTSMGMTAPRARAARRALAVLTVLLGLLAMHGLASTHHAAAATTASQHGAAQHDPAPADASAVQHHAAGAAVVHDTADVLAAPAGPACAEDCPYLALLCVAVLTGAALVLVTARRRSSPLVVSPARVRAPAPAPPVRHAQGPDPVRELCVSRT